MKKRIIFILIIIFMILCFIGIVYYSYKTLMWKKDVNENKIIIEEINDYVYVNSEDDKKYNIDFNSLKNQNSDTVAYLKVNNTKISHIVVKGNDNDYYLRHNFKKEWSSAGWVFADYHNKVDGSDKNLVIYGHSMRNKTMFGTLRDVVKKSWYENKDNYIIDFVTENGEYRYQVFSVYVIKSEDYYINTKFNNDSEFDKFIKTIKSRSKYDFNVDVSNNDKILTLSSCYDNNDRRVVLHAKLIN